ncbi:MAG: polysulfide reductase NrfD [Calditrichia bacterium]
MERKQKTLSMLGRETKKFLKFFLSELKPKGKLLAPFNIISTIILLTGAIILIIRFTQGLGAVTNLSQEYPWGFWISFDVITGVAFAGGAYVLCFMVYILNLKKYHPIVRVTVLNGFLAYLFYAGALVFDLGKPWNMINVIIGNSYGVSSIMFLVAWHFLLYMIAEFIEFSPAVAEWLGWKRIRNILGGMTIGVVILGITLSSTHQSALGALFLIAKSKIHPLWYSELLPLLFFVSSIFAGLSMVIFEGSISHKVFRHQISPEDHIAHYDILLGLSKICAGSMFVYLFLKILAFVHGQNFDLIFTPMGWWFLVEIVGFVALPCILFTISVRRNKIPLVKVAAALTLIGIILNRLNISLVAYNWNSPVRYFPSWMEIAVTLTVIFAEILVFRWVVNRMPVLRQPPEFEMEKQKEKYKPVTIEEEPEKWKVSVM